MAPLASILILINYFLAPSKKTLLAIFAPKQYHIKILKIMCAQEKGVSIVQDTRTMKLHICLFTKYALMLKILKKNVPDA